MTREEFDNLLVELSSAHVKWDTRFRLLAAYDDLATQRDNFRERCAELESRLDIGAGNMYDVVVLENEKLQEENTRLRDAMRLAVQQRNTLREHANMLFLALNNLRFAAANDMRHSNSVDDDWSSAKNTLARMPIVPPAETEEEGER